MWENPGADDRFGDNVDIVQLISAAGIGGIVGSLLTTLVQAWISSHAALADRRFQEKKEAYIGFLEALATSEIEPTPGNSLRAGHWINRCELVAPPRVRALAARINATNPDGDRIHPERPQVMAELKAAIREDLGIQP